MTISIVEERLDALFSGEQPKILILTGGGVLVRPTNGNKRFSDQQKPDNGHDIHMFHYLALQAWRKSESVSQKKPLRR